MLQVRLAGALRGPGGRQLSPPPIARGFFSPCQRRPPPHWSLALPPPPLPLPSGSACEAKTEACLDTAKGRLLPGHVGGIKAYSGGGRGSLDGSKLVPALSLPFHSCPAKTVWSQESLPGCTDAKHLGFIVIMTIHINEYNPQTHKTAYTKSCITCSSLMENITSTYLNWQRPRGETLLPNLQLAATQGLRQTYRPSCQPRLPRFLGCGWLREALWPCCGPCGGWLKRQKRSKSSLLQGGC